MVIVFDSHGSAYFPYPYGGINFDAPASELVRQVFDPMFEDRSDWVACPKSRRVDTGECHEPAYIELTELEVQRAQLEELIKRLKHIIDNYDDNFNPLSVEEYKSILSSLEMLESL